MKILINDFPVNFLKLNYQRERKRGKECAQDSRVE